MFKSLMVSVMIMAGFSVNAAEPINTKIFIASGSVRVIDDGVTLDVPVYILPRGERLVNIYSVTYVGNRFVTEPMEDHKPRVLKIYGDNNKLEFMIQEWK